MGWVRGKNFIGEKQKEVSCLRKGFMMQLNHDPLFRFLQSSLAYIADYEKFQGKGVDVIAFVSVNDAYVMSAFAQSVNAGDKVREHQCSHSHLFRSP